MKLPARLPLRTVPAGSQCFRVHRCDREASWFEPAPGFAPINRFDDPDSEFKVCYLATSQEASFAETFLRNPPVNVVSRLDLQNRCLTTFRLVRPARLVPLHGPYLARLGATAEIAASATYEQSESWARALWSHPGSPDGLSYRSRHDDSTLCIALFHRAADCVTVDTVQPLTQDLPRLARMLKRYNIALTR